MLPPGSCQVVVRDDFAMPDRNRLYELIRTTTALWLPFLFWLSAATGQVSPRDTFAGGTLCHLADHEAAPRLSVTVRPPTAEPRTGDPIELEWSVDSGFRPECRTPLYLMLATPMRTRFEGEKFLAFPPGADGPFGIKRQLEQTRVMVPLHLGPQQHKGTLRIKAYEAGPLKLEWALVEVSKLTANPQSRKDIATGLVRATAPIPVGNGITVVGGNPLIVVRDQFTTGRPKNVIWSNSGEFELQVYDGFYRVIDRRTKELLLERAGKYPNFSPTSRFLGAVAEGFEVIDLYSGEVIAAGAALIKERGFYSAVHLAAWSPGDAVLGLSTGSWAGIEVQQTLIDGSERSFPTTHCHGCTGSDTPMVLDLDAGVVAYFDELQLRLPRMVGLGEFAGSVHWQRSGEPGGTTPDPGN